MADPNMPELQNVPADTTPEERQQLADFIEQRRYYGMLRAIDRGHIYQLSADGIMLDHRPDYAWRFYQGTPSFFNRIQETGTDDSKLAEITVQSFGHLVMYILLGWETGIYNEFRHFQGRGLSKAQIMELVMYAQLNSGIRGLQLVYNAVGKHLVDWRDGPRPYQRTEEPAPWPKGWEADPDAFKAGLDLSVRNLTDQDRSNIEAWYDQNVGYLPSSVEFAMTYHPEFYKWHRARWEIIFQTLPKQVLPYIMIRQNMISGNAEGIREAVNLGRNWGMKKEWITHAFAVSAWYTGFEALHIVNQAVGDLMRDWQD